MRQTRLRPTRTALVLLTILLALGLAACGSDDDNGDSGSSGKTEAVEKAFLTAMVSHHESAITMSAIAKEKGEDPFITKLAGDITSTQEREIDEMDAIYKRLFKATLKSDPGAHDGLGLSAEQAGMTHSEGTSKMLEAADPFDRAFVDEMVPHHEGAIKMANVLLKSTKDDQLRKLAEGIISTQETEVQEMNAFRTREYGGPVPEGAGHGGGKEQPEGEEHGAGHSP